MLDTLELRLVDFSVAERSRLRLVPSSVDMETGQEYGSLLWSNHAGDVSGERAYYNADAVNVTVKSVDRVPMCFAKLSVPKLIRGDNFTPAGQKDTVDALAKLEETLGEVGIKCNVSDARLSRIDLTRNVITSEPFLNYAPVFNLLSAKRMNKRDYGETFLYHNTRREVCVYDKIHEMNQAGKITSHLPKNVMRFEARYLNGRKCREVLGMETVSDLVSGFDSLSGLYRNEMRSTLFSFEPPAIDLMCESELERSMRYFKTRYGRNWFDKYMRAVGVDAVQKSIGSPEILRRVIGRLYDGSKSSGKVQAWRVARKIQDARYDFSMMQGEMFERRSLSSLYGELRSGVLLAA